MNILAKNLLILASAGSGKTFQLGNRVIGLVARGAAPEKIVALTFTRKAAGEFADSVLTKLAEAARDGQATDSLRQAIGLPDADFEYVLERVVHALPEITLGTMDGFFSKIIRGFQYDLGLTGGKFDLLEGARATALTDELLAGILGDALDREESEEFLHAFRRATLGKENQGVLNALRGFTNRWQSLYRKSRNLDWGPADMMTVGINEWARQKSGMAAAILRGLDTIEYTRKGQREALENEIANLENHVVGGGSLGGRNSSLMDSILDEVATSNSGPLTVKSYKEFTIGGSTGETLRAMVRLAACCEMTAALLRTRAIREVVSIYDELCEKRLRRKGLLGFDDVKILMGEWAASEDARLRREAVDFRLDSRIDHWLLDEFQDTSRADWTGLQPLIDEAASDSSGTMFVVGDQKQAIYAWRGGDVGLFDEIMQRYAGNLEIAPMAESWRSSPEVLSLVNKVCGDIPTLTELFGEIAAKWDWQEHYSAERLSQPDKRGHARVEVVGKWEDRLERLTEILHELGVGQRSVSCGVLLRGNKQVQEVADHLRMRGFDVIEEGRREPAKDNPIGISLLHLLKWLAEPTDAFALEMVEMSPFAGVLRTKHGSSWRDIWEALTTTASKYGFAGMISETISDSWLNWSDFGRRRAGDLLAALNHFDAQDGTSPKEAAAWIERLEVAQSPGISAVQVMTIHKAKGLGFDMVVLPDIPDEKIPQPQYFEMAEGLGWLTQTPPKWARAINPEMRDAEEKWSSDQRYEAFCMLYVALTRAKRGLYVLLESSQNTKNPDKPSLANWFAKSIRANEEAGIVYQTGMPDWADGLPPLALKIKSPAMRISGQTHARQSRIIPSSLRHKGRIKAHSPDGIKFGNAVHALLQSVSWVDEKHPILPSDKAGNLVSELLSNPALRSMFERRGRQIELLQEQAADAVVEGRFLSGIMDRIHIFRNPEKEVIRVEIIDYKTDWARNPADLVDRYSSQMSAYRIALEKVHPAAEIMCALLSARHGKLLWV